MDYISKIFIILTLSLIIYIIKNDTALKKKKHEQYEQYEQYLFNDEWGQFCDID